MILPASVFVMFGPGGTLGSTTAGSIRGTAGTAGTATATSVTALLPFIVNASRAVNPVKSNPVILLSIMRFISVFGKLIELRALQSTIENSVKAPASISIAVSLGKFKTFVIFRLVHCLSSKVDKLLHFNKPIFVSTASFVILMVSRFVARSKMSVSIAEFSNSNVFNDAGKESETAYF